MGPGDQKVYVKGAEWMEAVRLKEIEDAKNASKLKLEKEEKFDAFGNLIEEKKEEEIPTDPKEIKKLEKKLKDMKKSGVNEDECLDLEILLDQAKKLMEKKKADEKAAKESEKAQAKAAKEADKKKAGAKATKKK